MSVIITINTNYSGKSRCIKNDDQRIENPRVAGSIPALGTTFTSTSLFAVSADLGKNAEHLFGADACRHYPW